MTLKTAGRHTRIGQASRSERAGFRAVALRLWPAVPGLCLARAAVMRCLPQYADGVLGMDAVLCLVACLSITPLMTVTRARAAKLRWWYGVWMFAIGAAAVALHMTMPPGGMAERMAGTGADWTGLWIVVLLLPMAATSSALAQKALGPEWKRWQRGLMWLVWAGVVIHLDMLHAWLSLVGLAAATLPLLVLRRPPVRQAVKHWRAGGYSTGGWWTVLAVLGTAYAAGLAVLLARQGVALAHAVTLT
jgi:hypothetical protein